MKLPIVTALLAFARKLRFPQLFLLTGAIFFADLLIPDMLPFADEALLGLATLLLASLKDRKQPADDVEVAAVDKSGSDSSNHSHS